MDHISSLDRLLSPDPLDVGCGETIELLDVYVDLHLADRRAHLRYPGVAVHLRDCPPCAQDFDGLLAAAGGTP